MLLAFCFACCFFIVAHVSSNVHMLPHKRNVSSGLKNVSLREKWKIFRSRNMSVAFHPNKNSSQSVVNSNITLLKLIRNKTLNTNPEVRQYEIMFGNITNIPSKQLVTTARINKRPVPMHFLRKIHSTITRSKDAVWATITLTFMCVILLLAVAQSRMWRDYHGSEMQGIPLPNFNERVLFKDVMEHKINALKELFRKKKKERPVTELESLLPATEWE